MKKLKVGQIGIGHNHALAKLNAVKHFPELFEIVGYAEESEDWIVSRGESYKDLERFTEDELIEKCDILLVECDVWNLTAKGQKCIDAGKHIHLDKPASGTMTEFEKLIHDAKAKNLTVQLGYMYRYNYAILKLLELINEGKIGEIYQIDAEMSTYHSDEYRTWLRHFKGGSMYIFGSHLIDLIVGILGEPKEVHPFIKQTGHNGVFSDDNCFALLEYDRAIARVTNLSVEVNGWGMRRFAVMGSKGTVEIKPLEIVTHMTLSTTDIASNSYADMKEVVDVKDVPGNIRYDDMIKDLHLSVIGEKPNPYGYERELAVQRTIMKAIGEKLK